jgi:hypothetical protein
MWIFYVQYFFVVENCAIYGIMRKNIVELGRPQKIWCAHIAYWTTKATNTWSEYVILLFHCNSCCMKVLQCYVIHKLPASFSDTNHRYVFQHMNVKASEVHKIAVNTFGMYTQHISLKYTFPLFNGNTSKFWMCTHQLCCHIFTVCLQSLSGNNLPSYRSLNSNLQTRK